MNYLCNRCGVAYEVGTYHVCGTLSRRDHFAAAAMQGLLANPTVNHKQVTELLLLANEYAQRMADDKP